MSFNKETLFKLLPLYTQVRDQETGDSITAGLEQDGPLKALLGLIAEQMAALEENFDQLYDDQFIETCAEWVVPYIGNLVGARGLTIFPDAPFSERAQVANTIAYRRRKGTVAVLEQLARDVTGWTANAVEYFQLLATTQYLNHLRPGNLSVSALRNWEKMEYVNTPFDKLTHTLDVRSIELRRGKYNIPNIGIFLWRLDAFAVTSGPAYKVDDFRYKFDALGKDTSLYNHPEPETEISHLATPINVPMPISRAVMYNYRDDYYGKNGSVFVDNQPSVSICNLSDATDGSGGWVNMPKTKVAVDPVLGRIAFPSTVAAPAGVTASYYYGFSSKIGGGEYGRSATFMPDTNIIKVSQSDSILAALNQLQDTGGVIELTDNAYYEQIPDITIKAGKKIEIRSADKRRAILTLGKNLEVFGAENAALSLNGLLISGGCIEVPADDTTGNTNQLSSLSIMHCTLPPDTSPAIGTVLAQVPQPRLIVRMPDLTITIDSTIMGPIRSDEGAAISVTNSIVDALDDAAIAYCGPDDTGYGAVLTVKNSTIIGKVATRIMQLASNTIFYAALKQGESDMPPVAAQRLQQGCVRFCYVPPGSLLPRKYNCQPAGDSDGASKRPVFNSLKYGDPSYCQLSSLCAAEISQGADNEAEMGVFCDLYQPQRVANLRTRLNEYLRFGLEAGIFFAS